MGTGFNLGRSSEPPRSPARLVLDLVAVDRIYTLLNKLGIVYLHVVDPVADGAKRVAAAAPEIRS